MKKLDIEEVKKTYAYKLLKDYGERKNQPIEKLPQELQLFLVFWLNFNVMKNLLKEWAKNKGNNPEN